MTSKRRPVTGEELGVRGQANPAEEAKRRTDYSFFLRVLCVLSGERLSA